MIIFALTQRVHWNVIAYFSVGVDEQDIANQVQIYPNPNDGTFKIEIGTLEVTRIEIFDDKGSLIYEDKQFDNPILVKLGNVAKGSYHVRLHSSDGIITKTVIVQ